MNDARLPRLATAAPRRMRLCLVVPVYLEIVPLLSTTLCPFGLLWPIQKAASEPPKSVSVFDAEPRSMVQSALASMTPSQLTVSELLFGSERVEPAGMRSRGCVDPLVAVSSVGGNVAGTSPVELLSRQFEAAAMSWSPESTQ